ncbi:MAG: aminotransferase class V-fold PLP-dependent enzyme [Planctomycetes bacterium]|nr:aminotransferase class V-fold PLP-dependent enzyme [Planctomycetota bacterium]
MEAERLVGDTRRKLTELFDGDVPDRMTFCPNCTDALNMALKGALAEGDQVVTTVLEHNSVCRPLQAMTDAGWITQTRVACDGEGTIDPDDRSDRPDHRRPRTDHDLGVHPGRFRIRARGTQEEGPPSRGGGPEGYCEGCPAGAGALPEVVSRGADCPA